jgi:hypothetical protein
MARILMTPAPDASGGAPDYAALMARLSQPDALDLVNGLMRANPAESQAPVQTTTQASTGTTTPTTTPTSTQTKAPATESSPDDEIRSWLTELTDRLSKKDKEDQAAKEAREREQMASNLLKLVGENDASKLKDALGRFETHFQGKLSEAETRESQLVERVKSTVAESALARATLGINWVNQAAGKDALAKFATKVEVVDDGRGGYKATEKGTGRPVEDLVKAGLASDEFAHFLPAQARGGIGHGSRPGPTSMPHGQVSLVDALKARIAYNESQQLAAGLERTSGLRLPDNGR